MTSRRRRLGAYVAFLLSSGLLFATPASADDTTTGILAGVGISAASGKTSLGEGAGAIEAGLLDAEAFQQAGAIIAGTVNQRANGRLVLILAHDEKIDLVMPSVVRDRLDKLTALVGVMCKPPATTKTPDSGGLTMFAFKNWLPDGATFQASDVVTAVTTETAIGGITLTAEDRLLINAILMNGSAAPIASTSGVVLWDGAKTPESSLSTRFAVPGEPVSYDAGSPTLRAYMALQDALISARAVCGKSDEGKALLGVADGFITSLNTVGAAGASPLAAAIQFDAVAKDRPMLLRVAIERIGGTSITRSGLIYTFGWPNAATVSAGLRVSFRLIDPSTPGMKAVGEVRCVVRQTNVKKIADVIAGKPYHRSITQSYRPGSTVCDYRVAV